MQINMPMSSDYNNDASNIPEEETDAQLKKLSTLNEMSSGQHKIDNEGQIDQSSYNNTNGMQIIDKPFDNRVP